ncbi:MAG: formylglycine-generating enzyme family protein [Deltaproteobacteria bacterium]|nr:formylglycine-generating enzyme family protein [Deltaproteobacteria bacterium]
MKRFSFFLLASCLLLTGSALNCGGDATNDPAGEGDDDSAAPDDDTVADDDASPDDDAGDDDDVSDDDTGDDDTSDDDTADDDTTGDDDEYCPEIVGALIEPEVVLIPAGVFMMGSPEEELGRDPLEVQHEVTLTRPFYAAKYEITQSLYKAVAGEIDIYQWECAEQYPVGSVSWTRAAEFCNELSELFGYTPCYTEAGGGFEWEWECDGFRLPTEAEWEFMARAGTATAFYNGDITDTDCADPLLPQIAWYCGNAAIHQHGVGLLDPNAFGVYDALGNIWEWVWDGWNTDQEHEAYYTADPVTDPVGGGGHEWHPYRGGAMFASAVDCRVAYRRFGASDRLDEDNGFRVVRTAFEE